MSSLTVAQATKNIEIFYKQYVPSYVAKLGDDGWQTAVKVFNAMMGSGSSLKASYDYVIANAMALAATFEHAYPSNPEPSGSDVIDPVSFVNKISASEAVNYLYPTVSAGDKISLIAAINNGSLTATDLGSAISILKPTNPSPTAEEIKAAPDTLTGAANLPDTPLHFPGLTDGQQDFLTSMYIGAFGRTPEYEGLKYWSSELANDLSMGMKQQDAYQAVGRNIYQSGSQNGEAGTGLQDADYVTFAYSNALGRAPDSAGYDYWISDLSAGRISRGDFLTTFLTAGMGSERDSNFLVARIAVGEFAAQKHVSSAGAPGIDSKAILSGVTDIASATTAINSIIAKYGTATAASSIELIGIPDAADSGLSLG